MERLDFDVKGNACQNCKHWDEPVGQTEKEFHSRCWGCVVISSELKGRWFSHYESKEGEKEND